MPECDLIVLCALPQERRAIQAVMTQTVAITKQNSLQVFSGNLGDHSALLLESGEGKASTERALDWLENQAQETTALRNTGLVGTGIAGALSLDLELNDLVSATWVRGPEDRAAQVVRQWPGLRPALFVTTEGPVITPEAKHARFIAASAARPNTSACVDLESAVVAHRCEQTRRPFVLARVISDNAMRLLPESIGRFRTKDGRTDIARVAWHHAIRPFTWREMSQLARDTRSACETLANQLVRDVDDLVTLLSPAGMPPETMGSRRGQ